MSPDLVLAGTTLRDVIAKLTELPDDATLFVRRPWEPGSECALVRFKPGTSHASFMSAQGLDYFLEIFVALEALEVFRGEASLEDRIRLIIFYAENDAYPEWAFEI